MMSDFMDFLFILAYMNVGACNLPSTPFCPSNHFPTFLTTPVGVGFRPYPKEECMLFCVQCSTLPLGTYGRPACKSVHYTCCYQKQRNPPSPIPDIFMQNQLVGGNAIPGIPQERPL